MKNQIKKYVKDNQEFMIAYTAGAIVGIGAYVFACNVHGFKMVRPIAIVDNKMFVQGVNGKIFRFESPTSEK